MKVEIGTYPKLMRVLILANPGESRLTVIDKFYKKIIKVNPDFKKPNAYVTYDRVMEELTNNKNFTREMIRHNMKIFARLEQAIDRAFEIGMENGDFYQFIQLLNVNKEMMGLDKQPIQVFQNTTNTQNNMIVTPERVQSAVERLKEFSERLQLPGHASSGPGTPGSLPG